MRFRGALSNTVRKFYYTNQSSTIEIIDGAHCVLALIAFVVTVTLSFHMMVPEIECFGSSVFNHLCYIKFSRFSIFIQRSYTVCSGSYTRAHTHNDNVQVADVDLIGSKKNTRASTVGWITLLVSVDMLCQHRPHPKQSVFPFFCAADFSLFSISVSVYFDGFGMAIAMERIPLFCQIVELDAYKHFTIH